MIRPIENSLIFSSARCGTSIKAHTLQMAYSRNIITESLIRVAEFITVLEGLTFSTTPYIGSDPAKPPWCPRNCTRRKGCQ